MMKIKRALVGVVALLLLMACGDDSDARQSGVLMEVAPFAMPCIGAGVGVCLQVREPAAVNWQLFYGSIDGFQFEEGIEYTLRVEPTDERPDTVRSRGEYRLLEVVRKNRVN